MCKCEICIGMGVIARGFGLLWNVGERVIGATLSIALLVFHRITLCQLLNFMTLGLIDSILPAAIENENNLF